MLKLIAVACLAFLSLSLKAPEQAASEPPLWLRYPAISPDGQTIVFCYKGDIYKVRASGGTAMPITLSEGHDFTPVWSPDGQTIAFASDRNGNFDVYTVAVNGGNARRLTFHSSNDVPQCFSDDGRTVVFAATRMDNAVFAQFPYGALSELYSVGTAGGRETQLSSIAAEDVKFSKDGSKMLFHDKKGYEDPWRKHHVSSVTRDLWLFTKADSSYKKLTDFPGEDRNPVWAPDEKSIYYLSEKSGSFNIWKLGEQAASAPVQVTSFDKNPVRFLSVSRSGVLCFGYNGEIFTQPGDNSTSSKVRIVIETDERYAPDKTESFTDGATEMSVSPNGKEVVFVVRGEVFVTSSESGTTRRITNTPEQERNVSFSPDGKSILYASERNFIWGIYRTSLVRKEEPYFFNSTLLREETLITGAKEAFQPKFSPDGKEIAYLEDRTAVRVYNIASKKSREIIPANRNYSYSDGDQFFDWSPDSRYLIVNFLQDGNWREQLGLADVSGTKPLINLSESGFGANGGRFMMNGKMMMYFSSRNGMKNVASHGNQSDVYGLFFTQEAYDRFKLKKEEYLLLKEREGQEKPKTADTLKKKSKAADSLEKKPQPIVIEPDGLENRKLRLTIHSSELSEALVTPDGEKLYYFCEFEDGIDLWVNKFKENETKLFLKLHARNVRSVSFDKDAKHILCITDGKIIRINLDNAEKKDIPFTAEMNLNTYAERAYLFEHMWRQVVNKFYVTDLQKTDWAYYKQNYARFLPHVNNNRDFAEMMSELLGELNASHTGCRYNPRFRNPDETANLGAFFDETHTGNGLKISEVLAKGPLMKNGTQIKTGVIIEKIDGVEITPAMNHYPLLNRKAGKNTLLSLYDPATKKRWDETIVPLAPHQVTPLLYQRWVKRMQQMTEKLSNGQIGYMHVQGMDDNSYREFYDQVMGKYVNKKALIVDTRYNGGGWLHDDLVTFLSGKQYIQFMPREQPIGVEPANKWIRPSAVLMSEGNYSDAHMFPVVYKTLGIGKLIGMPVPGTGTAVWWETQQDPTLVFGIPQVGVMTMDGKYYENTQLEPDLKVMNEYDALLRGEDQQLKKAVEVLMQ